VWPGSSSHALPAAADAHFSYIYQDTQLANPTWNMTVANSDYSYVLYTGGDSYLEMQDAMFFETVGTDNT
jgi:hypothetical protein